ncbi:hypothetical protein ACIQ6Y_31835 [Streptomyces sp. NPDC096205]|uniref:hypothetical protein n=1 Tax=Streptomyces sp. NPDC096205 TaxID=3366081 RepID=UPI0038301EBE
MYRQASDEGTALERYATLDALGQIRNDIARLRQSGAVVRGEVGHDAKATSMSLDAKTPKALLEDCVDLSRYETYDTRAKKVVPLPTAQPRRYVVTATAERPLDGDRHQPPGRDGMLRHAAAAAATVVLSVI